MIAGSRAAVDLPVVANRQAGWLKRHRPWLVAAALLAVLPHVPGLDSSFGRSLLSQMGIAAVFAMSYNLLLGQTGLLSFGHAVYFGLGAYAAIHLMRAIDGGLPIPMPLVPLAGAAGGLAFGMLFGSVTTRRAGVVFALISLGVGELVFAAMRMLQGFSGGEEGITANRGAGPHLAGFDFTSQLAVYYVIAFWAIVAAALMHAFLRTPVGRMCNAVRDNPERAEFIGYDAQRVRFVVFSVSAAACRPRRRPARDQLRDRRRRIGGRRALRRGAADGVHRRRESFHRRGAGRDHDHLAAGQPLRLHRRLAALPRPLFHGHRAVRARRARRPHPAARADRPHPRVLVIARAATSSRAFPRW